MSTDSSAILTGGNAQQTTITAMARSTRVVNFRIIEVNGVADRDMAARAVIVHADHGVVIHGGMVAGKDAMAGCAIVRAAARGALLARR